jgi:hypothetical protein
VFFKSPRLAPGARRLECEIDHGGNGEADEEAEIAKGGLVFGQLCRAGSGVVADATQVEMARQNVIAGNRATIAHLLDHLLLFNRSGCSHGRADASVRARLRAFSGDLGLPAHACYGERLGRLQQQQLTILGSLVSLDSLTRVDIRHGLS